MVIMLGIAMFTIVRSSRVMKNPSDTTSSTSHGFPAYFRTVFCCTTASSPIPGRARTPARSAPPGFVLACPGLILLLTTGRAAPAVFAAAGRCGS